MKLVGDSPGLWQGGLDPYRRDKDGDSGSGNVPPVVSGGALDAVEAQAYPIDFSVYASDTDDLDLVAAPTATHGTISNVDLEAMTADYTPPAYATSASDRIAFTVTDGKAQTAGAVSVNVLARNTAPATSGGAMEAVEGQVYPTSFFSFANDAEGDDLDLVAVPTATHGTISNVNLKAMTADYTPPAYATSASDRIAFTVTDGKKQTAGTISVTVLALFTFVSDGEDAIISTPLDPSETFAFSISTPFPYAGTTYTTSGEEIAAGPVWKETPVVLENGGVLTLVAPGFPIGDDANGEITITGQWYKDGAATGVTTTPYDTGGAAGVYDWRLVATDTKANTASVRSNEIDLSVAALIADQLFWEPSDLTGLTQRWDGATAEFSAGPPPYVKVDGAGRTAGETRLLLLDQINGVDLSAVAAGSDGPVEVYMEVEITAPVSATSMGIVLRGSGSDGSETGLIFRLIGTSPAIWYSQIRKYQNGATSSLATVGAGLSGGTKADTRICILAQLSGNVKRLKCWSKRYAEPAWQATESTDTTITDAGRIGIFQGAGEPMRCYRVGIGFNGQPAPRSAS